MEGRSLDILLGDISVPHTKAKGSMDYSNMMIEVDDVDLGLSSGPSTKVKGSRAQTSNVIGGIDVSLNIEPVINSNTRYGQMGKRNAQPSTIVANARKELESMKRSELPKSRMSMNESLTKQFDGRRNLHGLSRHGASM